jgi:hypothetical protein
MWKEFVVAGQIIPEHLTPFGTFTKRMQGCRDFLPDFISKELNT